MPTSSPYPSARTALGPTPPPSQHHAGSCAERAGGNGGTCGASQEASLPEVGLLPAPSAARPGPAAPSPPPLLLQHHPRGGAVTSGLHPRARLGTRRASLKRHRRRRGDAGPGARLPTPH